jgi:DNA gyrase/topoisomerase IV subunit B
MAQSVSKTMDVGFRLGFHPEEGVPVLEIVFTRLHAGGKFNKADGGAYAFRVVCTVLVFR